MTVVTRTLPATGRWKAGVPLKATDANAWFLQVVADFETRLALVQTAYTNLSNGLTGGGSSAVEDWAVTFSVEKAAIEAALVGLTAVKTGGKTHAPYNVTE